jgi:hypothetical protein
MKFNYKITQNENSITLLLLPVIFYSSTFLFEKYGDGDKGYNFATGSIKADYKNEIVPMIQDIARNLNEVFEKKLNGEKIIFADLFSPKAPNVYPLFTFEVNQAGDQTGNIAVSCRAKNANNKPLLFTNLAETEVIKKEDAYKPQYAIELELKAYFNDESLQKGIFAIFHRGIKCGMREDLTDGYAKNDKAWDGFDFVDDGLPF